MCVPLRLTSSSLLGRYFSTQGTSKSIELEEINSFDARKGVVMACVLFGAACTWEAAHAFATFCTNPVW